MSLVLGLSFKKEVSCTYEWASRKENDKQPSTAKGTEELCNRWSWLWLKMSFYETQGDNSTLQIGKREQKIEKKKHRWEGLKITIVPPG